MKPQAIRSQLSPASIHVFGEIQLYDQIDSTNGAALRQLQSGKAGNWILLAESQTAGRGRRGKQWLSPRGAGIYLTLVRQFDKAANSLQGLSLVTAISLQQALEELGVPDLQLKWPNDVLHRKRKLAGILLDLHRSQGVSHVVFGLGINLSLPAELLTEIERPVTDLGAILNEAQDGNAPDENTPDKNTIVAAIINRLCVNIKSYEDAGFAPFKELWNALDCYLDCDIVLQNAASQLLGKSLGVDDVGALIMQSASGIQSIIGGEIMPSLREQTSTTNS